jgi:stage III sporulation protein AD
MIKIILIALVCAFIIVYLKHSKSEYSDVAVIASSVLLIYLSLDYVKDTFEIVNKLVFLTNLEYEYYKIIFKILAISYVFEFASSTIEDMGLKSLANKLVLIGKIVILGVSAPIIYAVFNILSGLLL